MINYCKKRKSKLFVNIQNDIFDNIIYKNNIYNTIATLEYGNIYFLYLCNKYNRIVEYDSKLMINSFYNETNLEQLWFPDSTIGDFKCNSILNCPYEDSIYVIINTLLIKKSFEILFDINAIKSKFNFDIIICIIYYSIMFKNIEILTNFVGILLNTIKIDFYFLIKLYDMFEKHIILNLYCTRNHLKLLKKIIDSILYDNGVSAYSGFIFKIEHNKNNDILVYDIIYKKIIEMNILNTAEYKDFLQNNIY